MGSAGSICLCGVGKAKSSPRQVDAVEAVDFATDTGYSNQPHGERELGNDTRTNNNESSAIGLQPLELSSSYCEGNLRSNLPGQSFTPRSTEEQHQHFHSSLPYTPSGEDAKVYKYYCPLCMQYFRRILKAQCCGNYICVQCKLDYLSTKGIGPNQSISGTVPCPHCQVVGFCPSQVGADEVVRDYSIRIHSGGDRVGSGGEPNKGGSRFDRKPQFSPLRVGDSFDDLKRKMVPYRMSIAAAEVSIVSPSIHGFAQFSPRTALPVDGISGPLSSLHSPTTDPAADRVAAESGGAGDVFSSNRGSSSAAPSTVVLVDSAADRVPINRPPRSGSARGYEYRDDNGSLGGSTAPSSHHLHEPPLEGCGDDDGGTGALSSSSSSSAGNSAGNGGSNFGVGHRVAAEDNEEYSQLMGIAIEGAGGGSATATPRLPSGGSAPRHTPRTALTPRTATAAISILPAAVSAGEGEDKSVRAVTPNRSGDVGHPVLGIANAYAIDVVSGVLESAVQGAIVAQQAIA